ncbi:hypothetical protein [Methylovorus glucosotrophus]|uniref:Uncharacterized protein n=1 Tax=Methylovorus glucosotrophus (strain SIP3-4) TaxID=582744 RepID=C6XES6_METGS|nr:hypothetical protein [Methylovorus glucosotrophus]ACT52133.1 hypothetical protein Msip34_2909 [Methylovorus glucosotrophus SIP3-4]
MAQLQPNVTALKNILGKLKVHRLIVPLAYRIGYTTPTIYGWSKIDDEQKALSYLLLISQIDKRETLKDGPTMAEVIDLASKAVVKAMPNKQ